MIKLKESEGQTKPTLVMQQKLLTLEDTLGCVPASQARPSCSRGLRADKPSTITNLIRC